MKNLSLVLALCIWSIVGNAATYYVAPNGSNNNPGTITAPFATINKLSSVMVAGDVAYIRGGTYRSPGSASGSHHFILENLWGTAANPIKIWAYPGESPIFNLDNITTVYNDPTAFMLSNSSYVHLKGIRVTGLKQKSSGEGLSRGFHIENVTFSTIEFVEVDNIGGYGFYMRNGTNDNLFLNCDAHHIDDRHSGWWNGNGFDCTNGVNATRNTFEGCRTWWCSDDGFDLYGVNGIFTFKNCWSFWNGYQPGTFVEAGDGDGFKLGPAATSMHNTLLRTVTNCLAFENSEHGFNQNVGDLRVKLYNNTTFKNGQYGYMWDYISPAPAQDFKNNVSYMDRYARRGNETTGSNNSWNGGVNLNAADFLSISSTGVDGPRGSDGSLPVLDFLKLQSNSDLINAGINVGLPFLSDAPDLGAFELINVLINLPPTANAGADKTITLPVNNVTVSGSGTDLLGTIVAYQWTKVSGPSGGVISSASNATTGISSLNQGVYIFRLKVTDNDGATATDDIQITVNAAPVNIPPTCTAGPDKVITLPTNSVTLVGSGSDEDGIINGYLWSKISGPSGGSIASITNSTTSVSGLVQGTYIFELRVTDNSGATATSTVQVTVNAVVVNIAPVSNAGPDQSITLPTNSVSLTGSGSDADGSIAYYLWVKVSGPSTGTITTPTSSSTTIKGLSEGTYTYQLKVTDNRGAIGVDVMQITVGAAVNNPPVANAGADKTITLPTNSVSLSGSGSDPGGSIASYLWTKVSGPSGGSIANASLASTSVNSLTQGTYVYRLKVTDNLGATATDDVQVTVNAASNTPPTANAGADKTVTLPTNSVSLSGSGTDPGGSVASYKWTKVSGPSGGSIGSSTAATTSINALIEGTYVYRLKVTDNQGAYSTDDVQVTVNPASTGLKVIRVNIYGGTTTYTHPKWNNWKPAANVTSAAYKYEDGTQSTVTSVVSAQSKIQDNGSSYGAATVVCPPAVLRFASAHTGTRTFTVNNLNPSRQYSFEFYASSNVSAATTTDFIINGWSYPINTYNNLNAYAEFINVRPNSSGSVVITMKAIGTYHYLTAFTIIEQTGAVSSVPSTSFSRTTATASPAKIKGLDATEQSLEVSAYPVPFTTSFTLHLKGGEDGSYTYNISDLSGRLLLTKVINKQGVVLNENIYMGNLPKGTYMLQVVSPGLIKTNRQLIKN